MKQKSIFYLLITLLSFFSTAYGQGPYYLKTTLTPTLLINWTDDPTGVAGSAPADFSITTTWNLFNTTTLASPNISFTGIWDLGSSSNSTVNLGNNTNPATLVVNGGTIILGGASSEFNVQNSATVSVQGAATFPTSQMRPLIGSTFIFGSGSPNIPAFSGTNSSYKNIIINSNNNLGASIICVSTLSIASTATLSLNNFSLSVGNFDGAGMLAAGSSTSSNTAALNVVGTGGTLNLANGFGCFSNVTINLASNGGDLVLASNTLTGVGGMTVHSGQLNLMSGNLHLNGQDLLLTDLTGNGLNNAGGRMGGRGASDLQIRNSPITGSSAFDGQFPFLNSLTLNSTSQTYNLISDILVFDSLSVLSGTLNTNNHIKIKSDDGLKGRLSRVGGSVNGSISIETLLYGGTTGWANIGGPGLNGPTVAQWDTWSSGNVGSGLPMTCTGCQVDPAHFSPPWNSIYTWAEPTSTYVPATSSTQLTPGLGFWAYVGNGQSSTSNLTLLNSGTPVVGNFTMLATNTSSAPSDQGYNLISNPYPSPISWSKVWNNNSTLLDPTIYVWNANTTSVATYNGNTHAATNSLTDVLPVGQGFYAVVASAGTKTISFAETDKLNSHAHLLKPAANLNSFKLKVAGPYGESDETVFCFFPNATLKYDQGYDSKKMFAFSPGYVGTSHPYTKNTTISSKDVNGEFYAISAIPLLAQDISVPVLVTGMANGSYTISALEYKQLSNCLTLKDNLLKVSHDLKSGDYVFQMNDTTSKPRFELFMCKDESLTTSVINVNTLENSVLISQDVNGVFVNTMFDRNTKATISAYNIVGQKVMDDIHTEGTANSLRLPLHVQNQIVIVKVSSEQGTVTKKIITH